MGVATSDSPVHIVLLFAREQSAERIQQALARRPDFILNLIRESPDLLLAPAYDIHPEVVIIGPLVSTLQKIRWITRLRAVLPAVGIVAVVEHRDEQYGRQLMEFGANAFVADDELDTLLIPAILDAAGRRL